MTNDHLTTVLAKTNTALTNVIKEILETGVDPNDVPKLLIGVITGILQQQFGWSGPEIPERVADYLREMQDLSPHTVEVVKEKVTNSLSEAGINASADDYFEPFHAKETSQKH